MNNTIPGAGIDITVVFLVCVIALVVLTSAILIISRYRKCPSDKILVIYGKIGRGKDGESRSAKCIHGGAAFIVPVFQAYEYMDLTPMSISVDLRNALSRQNIRVDVPSRFTVGISTEAGVMQNAAERLLGLKLDEIKQIAENSGVSGDVVINTVRSLPDGEGFNAATDTYEDLLAAGVTDPVKVTRSALQNAASIAGLFLTTEAVVANKPEPKSAAPAAGADMGY